MINDALHLDWADAVFKREFSVFGVPLPHSGPWPWHLDWRFDHEWRPGYFRDYSLTARREVPYDVKFPWELSRLAFLPSLVQADVLDGGSARTKMAFETLSDWNENNPLAHSVNWYPMEAAMRGIELCFLADMARQRKISDAEAGLLLRLLAAHGEFVMRTLEFTDNAGNHYMAELVALLLIGRTLEDVYPPARRWRDHAARRIGFEVMRQFLPDGVNFEGSTAYHRLVLTLALVASVALKRSGQPLDSMQRARLWAGARYNANILRPDGLCPLIGDSDDAVVFGMEHRHVRDHAGDVGVAALAFGDADLKSAAGCLPMAGLWLFGRAALSGWQELGDVTSAFMGSSYFAEGGVVVAKSDRHYFIMDVGEVGQNGVGGHGHNDLLSFELFLNGFPFAVDSGSYIYSGDFDAHDRFRATRAHNGLVVDDMEIARLTAPFRIENSARPTNVRVQRSSEGNVTVVSAGHTGYRSLSDPVMHYRTVTFDSAQGELRCDDRIQARGAHKVTRYLHLAPGVEPVLKENEAYVKVGNKTFVVNWDQYSRAHLEPDTISSCFGRLLPTKMLVLDSDVTGSVGLAMAISPSEQP